MKKNRLEIIKGDITNLNIDAIVNAANTSLRGGGGVDGAIHRAAGPELLAECEQLNGCQTGNAKITAGYNLKAKYIIHTVGPVWSGGFRDEPELLASCYRTCLKLAEERNVMTISFPSISTGVYGYPVSDAAQIAIHEVKSHLEDPNSKVEEVIFVLFDQRTFDAYASAARACADPSL